MRRELKPGVRAAADRAADYFGGDGNDYVFTGNATTGINAVLAPSNWHRATRFW